MLGQLERAFKLYKDRRWKNIAVYGIPVGRLKGRAMAHLARMKLRKVAGSSFPLRGRELGSDFFQVMHKVVDPVHTLIRVDRERPESPSGQGFKSPDRKTVVSFGSLLRCAV
jgi:hypothetical protein